jgi:hypothetical protein
LSKVQYQQSKPPYLLEQFPDFNACPSPPGPAAAAGIKSMKLEEIMRQ